MKFSVSLAGRRSATILILCALLATAGCGIAPIVKIPPSGAPPGLAGASVTYPEIAPVDTRADVPYNPGMIEILGWVETERLSSGITGRAPGFGSGDLIGLRASDYGGAFEQLRKEHNLDGLLNKTVDTERWVLNLYLVRFNRFRTRLGGVGYRFRRTSQ